MPRARLGVVLLVPAPVAGEVDVLRRAVGAGDLVERIAPHLTLVPPVNVAADRVEEAGELLRWAAEAVPPFRLTLGPVRTFLPVNPVLFLDVGGDVASVDRLRERVFRAPLERPLSLPFQPHVTVLDDGPPDRIRDAVHALSSWRAEVTLTRLHLLEESRRDDGLRVWRPVTDAPLGGAGVVGRGGLELAIDVAAELDPDAARFASEAWAAHDAEHHGGVGVEPLAVSARRAGRVVGTAVGRTTGRSAQLSEVVVAPDVRREGIGAHLVAAFCAEAARRGCGVVRARTEAGGDAEPFWRRLGWVEEARVDDWAWGRPYVLLRRDL